VIDAGDVVLADVRAERRTEVLVLSTARFHRLAERAVVAPRLEFVPAERFPWWVDTELGVFAVDRMATIPIARLLDPVGRVTSAQLDQAHRAVRAIV
jgi:mRNA-degrading endonuclease toxin of MazEF toxin-antitoxin module